MKQSSDDAHDTSAQNVFHLCADDVPPGFAMLRYDAQFQAPSLLFLWSKWIVGAPYLSNSMFMQVLFAVATTREGSDIAYNIQGPSLEEWTKYMDRSESGNDNVYSIHCQFWPMSAEEWLTRPWHFGWPTPRDIETVVSFGCHLVPVGHPLSTLKDIHWRISFSIAERTLVWSFNHIQIQCYAIMKLILKEFIKPRCSPQSNVICSYFIKTFLFWMFETVDENFWCSDNFRGCVNYLTIEFSKCIRKGELKHYFVPRFNLLSIKLTKEAQKELLQILETDIQCDVSIFKECKTLRNVWTQFTTTPDDINTVTRQMKEKRLARNDKCMMRNIVSTYTNMIKPKFCLPSVQGWIGNIITQLDIVQYKTPLILLVLIKYLSHNLFVSQRFSGNRRVYKLQRLAHSKMSFDISTCKLWYALVLVAKGDYHSCLSVVNDVLSCIPPYALYCNNDVDEDNNTLHLDKYFESNTPIYKRARSAWLFDLCFRGQNIISWCVVAVKLPI